MLEEFSFVYTPKPRQTFKCSRCMEEEYTLETLL